MIKDVITCVAHQPWCCLLRQLRDTPFTTSGSYLTQSTSLLIVSTWATRTGWFCTGVVYTLYHRLYTLKIRIESSLRTEGKASGYGFPSYSGLRSSLFLSVSPSGDYLPSSFSRRLSPVVPSFRLVARACCEIWITKCTGDGARSSVTERRKLLM